MNGQWAPVKSVKNNGDGTVTCVFEDICPVAFCVEPHADANPPKTGDAAGGYMLNWLILLVASAAVVVVLIVNRRKFVR